MRKKMIVWHMVYYVLFLALFITLQYFMYLFIDLFLKLSGKSASFGFLATVIYAFLFIGTPFLIAVLTRFSLLKWYVDPFAAALVPLYYYLRMIFNSMKKAGYFPAAFQRANQLFSANGGEGWLLLIVSFVFGLAASFSLARKKEESISYRLLAKISAK